MTGGRFERWYRRGSSSIRPRPALRGSVTLTLLLALDGCSPQQASDPPGGRDAGSVPSEASRPSEANEAGPNPEAETSDARADSGVVRQPTVNASDAAVPSELDGAAPNDGALPTSGDSDAASELSFVTPLTLEWDAAGLAPLSLVATFETSLATNVVFHVNEGGESWQVERPAPVSQHRHLLLGFKPDTAYELTATARAGDRELVSASVHWQSPPLPADLPSPLLVQSHPERMEPGMTLFDLMRNRYLVVVGPKGNVRWFQRTPESAQTVLLTPEFNLLRLEQNKNIYEADWQGNLQRHWYAEATTDANVASVPVGVFHHGMDLMPNGNIVTLGWEVRTIDDFPLHAGDPDTERGTARVRGDVVVEFTRTGELVNTVHLLDILDPRRIGYDGTTEGRDVDADWSHGNSVQYEESSDAYVVSLRHQDAVIKIDRQRRELVWILGTHANWDAPWRDKLLTPIGEARWFYHQHAAELSPEGDCLLYDNGTRGAPAFEPLADRPSRAVRYHIDEAAKTAEQVWEHQVTSRAGSPLFSSIMGDADVLPRTRNVLVTSGALTAPTSPPGWTQIVEVTEAGDVVFELEVPETGALGSTFSANRIDDIRFLPLD